MNNIHLHIPLPANEPAHTYAPGTEARRLLKAELQRQSQQVIEIPLLIGGKEVRTGTLVEIRAPHRHDLLLARYHQAGPEEVQRAIRSAKEAAAEWAALPWHERAAIFQKAAELLAGPYRMILNAATMLGQSKTAHQAEIDSACEMIDFLRFNVHFWDTLFAGQPPIAKTSEAWNRTEYRPLEGFVFAVTPFNFTAIGGNLPTAPAMAGNVVIWKPSGTAVLSNFYLMRVLQEAGLPAGVINFVPSRGATIGDIVFNDPEFAGLHFTGSTSTFNGMWRHIGENQAKGMYRNFPRLVGETGGKDFVFACPDADPETVAVALVRGAFEYQGQKCSAASRAYMPSSLWPEIKSRIGEMLAKINVGDVSDFTNYMGAVIDGASYKNIVKHIEVARASSEAAIAFGGTYDEAEGWFIQPTVIETTNPKFRLMAEEIFGPVLTVYVYDDSKLDETLTILDETSPYALTGAVFSRDRGLIGKVADRLRYAAGNFYINDKPTGAVVGQQPFGGSRASGTNDKAGSPLNLMRWVSPRTIKETLVPPRSFEYPFMAEH
ncbi:MAG TPA: L-glutamate gamma-semialdehyde dehydrogenase [Candidatus Ozemobacteraceae bacterium]|nr:L-glutamate gamma-semialdehyde dehydrogenase [Candidatus Ozemobacteraceae bacterium]